MIDANQTSYEKGKLYNLNLADLQPDPEQLCKCLMSDNCSIFEL